MVSERFLRRCDERLAVFLQERECNNLDTLATTADQNLEAQGINNLAKGKEAREEKGKPPGQYKKLRRQQARENLSAFMLEMQEDRSQRRYVSLLALTDMTKLHAHF
ncbi:hypothetical protein MTO96_039716 [Rhipicephalus appendiculatus]